MTACSTSMRPVPHYVPELKSSAYADARIRDVLDMRVSLDFEETYHDPRGDFARYRRAGLLEPVRARRHAGDAPRIPGFAEKGRQATTAARSTMRLPIPTSWALSSNAHPGQRFADLVAIRLWQPLGARQDAYVTVDATVPPAPAAASA